MSTERPLVPGWQRRGRLLPVGVTTSMATAIIVAALYAIAAWCDGLDSNGKSSEAYRAVLFPYDDETWGKIASDQLSACMLLCLAVLDMMGYESEQTDSPYHPRLGRAVADFVELGLEVDQWLGTVARPEAYFDAAEEDCPLPSGPAMVLVGNNAGEGLEHGFICLDGLDEDDTCDVLEGGQPSQLGKGFRVIRSTYKFERRSSTEVWASRPGSRARRVRGWLDLTAIPFTQSCTLPEEDGPAAALLPLEQAEGGADEHEARQAGEDEPTDGAGGGILKHGAGTKTGPIRASLHTLPGRHGC